jgi:hypothetical protein
MTPAAAIEKGSSLACMIDEAKRQLQGMRLKQTRLARAIHEREAHLLKLEATAALGSTSQPNPHRDEC